MSSRATQPPVGWRQRTYETFWLRTLEKIFTLTEINIMGLYCSPRAGRQSSLWEMAAVNLMSPFLKSARALWFCKKIADLLVFSYICVNSGVNSVRSTI